MGSDSGEIYNTINGCRDYLETLNITNKPINYLIVRDPIENKIDSGEIDRYYISTPVFISVDANTILLTSPNFVELFKCERVAKAIKNSIPTVQSEDAPFKHKKFEFVLFVI